MPAAAMAAAVSPKIFKALACVCLAFGPARALVPVGIVVRIASFQESAVVPLTGRCPHG